MLFTLKKNSITYAIKMKITKDIACAINFLHTQEPTIIHGGLKSTNIFFNSDTSECVVGDFLTHSGTRGAIEWCAPELFSKDKVITQKVDSYSYGVCLWEIFSEKIPFASLNLEPISLALEIIGGKRPTPAPQIDVALVNLIHALWHQDEYKRPAFSEIIEIIQKFEQPIDPATPANLLCPITHSLIQDPVIAEDGYTYERAAILKWVKEKGTSPMTREKISLNGLRPNRIVAALIQEHIQAKK